MKSKILLALIPVVFLTGCSCDGDTNSTNTTKYIETDYGIYPYADGYCEFGILTNNYKTPITSINGKIPCKGYIELTDEDAQLYDKLKDFDFTKVDITVRLKNE